LKSFYTGIPKIEGIDGFGSIYFTGIGVAGWEIGVCYPVTGGFTIDLVILF
jgi:hypothetical protein